MCVQDCLNRLVITLATFSIVVWFAVKINLSYLIKRFNNLLSFQWKNTDWNLFWYVLRWNKSGQTMHAQYQQYENRSKRLCQPVNNLGHDSKKTTLISRLTSWKCWRQWRRAQSKHKLNSPPFLLWKRVTISTQSSSPKASKVWFLAMEPYIQHLLLLRRDHRASVQL